MANTISKAFVEQFKANVIHLAQQRGSRLEKTVRKETVRGSVHNFDRIGATADEQKSTRHKATPTADVPHSRRVVTLATYHWAEQIDNDDQVRMLINPQSEYAKAAAWAMGRRKDDLIIAAATGNATDGDGGTVSFTAGNIIAHGSAGLTLAKLREARKILLSSDVDEDMEPMYVVCSAEEMDDLLSDTTITSADYNTVRALVDGKIDTFLGFKFIRTERIATTTGTPSTHNVLAYCQSAIGLAVGEEVKTIISDRPDISHADQVYMEYTAQATRLEEEKVVSILCTTA